ncbi:MAG: MXAN_5187 family protein [Polyangia bacterium]
MFISRFWTLLLALVVGGLLAVVFLAKDVVNRERVENATALLYKELDKVDIALNLHARKRLDVLMSAAVDPQIRKMLAQISADEDKAEKLRQKLLTALRERNEAMGKYKADSLLALDIRGEVITQAGERERQKGYDLSGFPAVDAALRGYVRDDVWKLGNDVYLVAARPVIDQGRYAGAVVHLSKVDDGLASDMSVRVQMGFFAGEVMIAVGSPQAEGVVRAQSSYFGQPLSDVLSAKKFVEKGYSDVHRIETQDGDFMAIYSLVRGEAAKNQVGYAIITPLETMAAFTEFYEKAGKQDIDALPVTWIVVFIVLAVLIGWFWNWLEAERPLRRLHKHVDALEQADPKDQLNIYRFRRRTRKLAASINRVLDAKVKQMLEAAGHPGKDIDSILGGQDKARLSSASFKFAEPSAEDIPPPPEEESKPGTGKQVRLGSGPQAKPGGPPPTPGGKPGGPPPAPGGKSGGPPPAPGGGGVEPMTPEEEQKYFRQIYEEFVALKKKLGEPVEQLQFERFETTLKKNRDTLKSRYGCARVKFQVYEKDGKASLKATPVK